MDSVHISLISYLNSRPFVFGLQNSALWKTQQFSFDVPAVSALKLIQGKADVGIIPIATLPLVPNGQIIGNYCISADNEVYTVALFSNVPIAETQHVYLDLDSKTSVALTKLLASTMFNQTPIYHDGLPDLSELNTNVGMEHADCFLLIGDKVFEYAPAFKYKLDLAQQWKIQTGMPFVFAAWIANRTLSQEWISAFDQALSIGVRNIGEVSLAIQNEYPGIPVHDYLTKYIQFKLTKEKRYAIEYFLRLTQV